MKTNELEQLDLDALRSKHSEMQLELVKLNAQVATGTTPKSPGQIKQVKKNIAKILTMIHKKERHKL